MPLTKEQQDELTVRRTIRRLERNPERSIKILKIPGPHILKKIEDKGLGAHGEVDVYEDDKRVKYVKLSQLYNYIRHFEKTGKKLQLKTAHKNKMSKRLISCKPRGSKGDTYFLRCDDIPEFVCHHDI
jgi:hypothetical protein